MPTCKYCGKMCGKNGLISHERRCLSNPDFVEEFFGCSFCGKLCKGTQALHKHERHCRSNPNCQPQAKAEKETGPIKYTMVNVPCSYCGKICKNSNSLAQHSRVCKANPDRALTTYEKTGISNLSNVGWSKGLTKDTDKRIANISKSLKEGFNSGKITPRSGFVQSDTTKAKLSAIARAGKFEEHFGRRRTFDYAGYKFISSYEVAVAKSLDEAGIIWEKPKSFPYVAPDGSLHNYTPDLYLPEYDLYLDPKNDFLINNINPQFGYSDIEKIHLVEAQNKIRVLVLNKDQLNWESIKILI